MVGADETLKKNLETFFHLDYPSKLVEIIFCVPTADDSSLPIIAELRAEFPALRSSISIGTATAGINPKINNIGACSFDVVDRKHPLFVASSFLPFVP